MSSGDRHRTTRVIPIGGVGEFGANATVIQSRETTILVDFGLMFPPDKRQPGVDFYINDPDLLLESFPDLSAIFLTHGHEDHIGGLSFLLAKASLPIYAMPYTARLVRRALAYDADDVDADLRETALGEPVRHGDITVEMIGVTHSIVQATALSIKTPDGHVIHSGDFKVDALPEDGYPFQSDRFRALGEEGVDLLIMDSTNAVKHGFSPIDHEIEQNLEAHIAAAPGRVFLTTFSSHMPRIRRLHHIAKRTGRRLAFIGRSFGKHFQLALDTRYLTYHEDVITSVDAAAEMPDDKVIFVVTGSQGEQGSALMRIKRGTFRGISFQAGDTLIFSSKTIPGNERAVFLLSSDLQRDGVEVIADQGADVHTSGHGYREDMAYMLALTKPRFVAPIHGEFSFLRAHHAWLETLIDDDQRVLLIDDGDVLEIADGEVRLTGTVPVGLLPVDGNQNLPIDRTLISERKDMMYSGLVLVSAQVRLADDFTDYEVETHGLVERRPGQAAKTLEAALGAVVLEADDPDLITETLMRCIKKSLKTFFNGRPLIKLVLNGRIVR